MAESEGDWQLNKSHKECSWQMFERGIATDVTFVIGGNIFMAGKKISAHKFMLIARSPVFERMFTGALAETSGEIKIRDCHSLCAFKEMLRFIYTDRMEIKEYIVMDVLYLSRKYMLPKAIRTCMRYVKHYCKPANVLFFLDKAISNAEDEIKQVCMAVIQRQTSEIIILPRFQKIPIETLVLVLEQKILNATEEQLFEACIKWAKHKLNLGRNEPCDAESLRDTLGQCLYKIQYQNMDVTSFTKLVVNQNILQQNDALKFYQCIALKHETQGDSTCFVALPEGYETGRGIEKYREIGLSAWRKKSGNIQYNTDVSINSISIKCSKTVKLAMLRLLIKIDPEITMDASRDICHIDDSLDTVVIDNEPCCHRIQYATTHESATKSIHENQQKISIHLENGVVPSKEFDVKLRLRSHFRLKLTGLNEKELVDKGTGVFFKFKWAEDSLPLKDIGFILCS